MNLPTNKAFPKMRDAPNLSSQSESSLPLFSSENGELFDRHYNKINYVKQIDPMPTTNDADSYSDYVMKISKWKEKVKNVLLTSRLPSPVVYAIPRPQRPSTDKSRQKQNEAIRLTPNNFCVISELIQNGNSEINVEEILPEKNRSGGGDLKLGTFVSDKLPWSSKLVVQKPNPFLYKSFTEYEYAMTNWGKLIGIDDIPPNPEKIGEMAKLKPISIQQLSAPPPPLEKPPLPKPLTNKKISEKKIENGLKNLHKMYLGFLSNVDSIDKSEFIFTGSEILPPISKVKDVQSLIKRLCDFGLPQEALDNSPTYIMRQERALVDIGSMTNDMYILSGSKDTFSNQKELISLIDRNPSLFLKMDISPIQMREYISAKIPGTDPVVTVGERIFDILSLEEIIELSFFSESNRFSSKFMILLHYMLQFPYFYDSIFQLDLYYLERFVKLIIFNCQRSFSVEDLPDDEIEQTIEVDPQYEAQIENIAARFRQAQLINTLGNAIFSASHLFARFLPFLRDLIHKSYNEVSEMVKEDSISPKLFEGFFSTNIKSHYFYYRLIRTIILQQYTKTIRVFSGHDLLTFMKNGLNSQNPHVRRNSLSLWQLFIHSDSSIVLQNQVIHSSPSSVVSLITSASDVFHSFLMSVFLLFRQTRTMFTFQPFPFSQFNVYFSIFCANLDNHRNSQFLYALLTLCAGQDEAIYCFKRDDFNKMINKFAATTAIQLISESPSKVNMRCLKVLYKIRFLVQSSVNFVEIWNYILEKMIQKHDKKSLKYKLQAWKAFRNAVLFQPHFVQFLLQTECLSQKLTEAFSSIDEKVIVCMIYTLPSLAKPTVKVIGVGEITKKNLSDLFSYLGAPSVHIAGKLFSVYQMNKDTLDIQKMHAALNQFLNMLFESEPGSILYTFMNTPHVRSELSQIFTKFASLYVFHSQ